MKKKNDQLEVIFSEILDSCFYIHSLYGPGLFESFYEAVLFYELNKKGLAVKKQVGIHPQHDGHDMGLGYQIDILVEEEIIVELKSKEKLTEVDHKQILTYMKLADIKLGLLVNFGVSQLKDGIHRKVNKF